MKERVMEFLVEFELNVPEGTPESDVKQRESAEAAAGGDLAREGHLVRLWRPRVAAGETKVVGLYRADSEAQLEGLLGALPIKDWMQITGIPLEPPPNEPTSTRTNLFHLPNPRLTPVYRLEATLGEPLDLGAIVQGRRRIVPLTGGTFI